MRIGLLHGFAGDPRVWDDCVAGWPEPRDQLFAIALPGHHAPLAATWHDNVAAVASALAAARAEIVIGYSLGARIALAAIADQRIARAVLIGVNPGLADGERPARRAADRAWSALIRDRGIGAFVDAWQAQPLFASQARVEPARLAERRAWRLALASEPLARSLEVMGLAEMPDYRTAPLTGVTLVVGALDSKFRAIANQIVAPLVVIDDAGHDPTLEQPVQLAHALSRIVHADGRES